MVISVIERDLRSMILYYYLGGEINDDVRTNVVTNDNIENVKVPV